jgi:pimeloyl-ACP methyl ester carboxylesterase
MFHGDRGRANPAVIEHEVDVMLGHPRDGVARVPDVPAGYEPIEDRLGAIACPVLLVWGTQDLRPALGRMLADALPDARLVEIEGAGHHVNGDAPEDTAEAIAGFLADVSRAETIR